MATSINTTVRGTHTSPGVYTREVDLTTAINNLGITNLGVVGETVMGPAFQATKVENYNKFKNYFGGQDPTIYKGSQYPRYELPYIAKSYLSESNSMYVTRVLGLTGFEYPTAYIIKAGGKILGTIRPVFKTVTSKSMSASSYSSTSSTKVTGCTIDTTKKTADSFVIKVGVSGETDMNFKCSCISTNANYLPNVLGINMENADYPIFVEEFYDGVAAGLTFSEEITIVKSDAFNNFKTPYKSAQTPWFVSDEFGGQLTKLFKFYTKADGNSANTLFKISIANIDFENSTFDVFLRDFYDSDDAPSVIESYTKCTMDYTSDDYIGIKIGTLDGKYLSKSDFILVDLYNEKTGVGKLPLGFEGFPMRDYTADSSIQGDAPDISNNYNQAYESTVKERKQYFGISDRASSKLPDSDFFSYKGISQMASVYQINVYEKDGNEIKMFQDALTAGTTVNEAGIGTFTYADITSPSYPNKGLISEATKNEITGTNKTIYSACTFVTSIVETGGTEYTTTTKGFHMNNNITDENKKKYVTCTLLSTNTNATVDMISKKLLKFSAAFYGGFDGWDISRDARTTGNKFSYNKYAKLYTSNTGGDAIRIYSSSLGQNNSDYYAFLLGVQTMRDSATYPIDLIATPGIDDINDSSLVSEIMDLIEDERKDCLYIVTTPDKPYGNDDSEEDMYSADDIVSELKDSDIDTSYAATYYPWIQVKDTENSAYLYIPPTGEILRNMAYTDNSSYPWFAPAGTTRGRINCIKAKKSVRKSEEDSLYDGRINPVKTFASEGVLAWGNKNLQVANTQMNRVNTRRLLIRMKKLVSAAVLQILFEPDDSTTKTQFVNIVDPILKNIQAGRGIFDYKITVDDSAEAREQHRLPAIIQIKVTPTLEFIELSFVITPQSAEFTD